MSADIPAMNVDLDAMDIDWLAEARDEARCATEALHQEWVRAEAASQRVESQSMALAESEQKLREAQQTIAFLRRDLAAAEEDIDMLEETVSINAAAEDGALSFARQRARALAQRIRDSELRRAEREQRAKKVACCLFATKN
jgi:septal ring factor EnvC (AmiA/AmiB activator)